MTFSTECEIITLMEAELFFADLKAFIDARYEPITMLFQLSGDYTPEQDADLETVIKSCKETFQEKLFLLIREKRLSEVEIYKKANLNRQHFSRMRSNTHYQPTKRTVIALAFAMQLSEAETDDLLQRAGLALSPSSKADLIVRYFLMHEEYDVVKLYQAIERYA